MKYDLRQVEKHKKREYKFNNINGGQCESLDSERT